MRICKTTTKADATSKAKLLRNVLRVATIAGASAQAQAVLAILIAESWPEHLINGKPCWVATLGYPVLTRRLNASTKSVRRWCSELVERNLVVHEPGSGRRISRWLIARRVVARDHPEGSPMHMGVVARDHPECPPVTTVLSTQHQDNITAHEQSPLVGAAVEGGADG